MNRQRVRILVVVVGVSVITAARTENGAARGMPTSPSAAGLEHRGHPPPTHT